MRHNIQTRLTRTYIGLAVTPLIILGLLISWQGFVSQEEAVRRQADLAKRVAVEADNFFAGVINDLELIVQLQGSEGLSQNTSFSPLFGLLTQDTIYEELTYVDGEGIGQNHEIRLGLNIEEGVTSFLNHPEFQIPFTQALPYFSPIHLYPATGEPVISISIPINNLTEGTVEGVLIAETRLIKIWDIVAGIPLNKGQSVYIVDATGLVIAHLNRSVPRKGIFFTPPQTSGITKGLNAPTVLLATETLQLGDQTLTVIVEQSVMEAFALPVRTMAITIIVSLISLGAASYYGIRSVRQIVHPIQGLAATARAIRAGEWQQQVNVQTGDELGELGEAFNLMVSRLQTNMATLKEEVHERIHIEEALRKAEAHFRILVEQLPAITYIDDVVTNYGKSIYISPQVETILGYTQEEWLNQALDQWLQLMHSDDHASFLEKYERCYTEGQPLDCEYRLTSKTGETIWFHDQAIRLNDQDGHPLIIQGVMVDISDRKKNQEEIHRLNSELEERVLERTAQLEAANKELESFSYSISHDLRTPLRGIIGFSSLLLNNPQHPLSEDNQHYLNRVRENAQRMGQLVDDLLKFSRLSRYPITKHRIQPSLLAQEALDELSLEWTSRKIEITINDLPACQADPSLLRQVFANLISNAIKYSRNKEIAQIEIGCETQNNETIYFVRDNGTGFDMQYADKLFGVFQRLHSLEDFEGTGVGLAITHRIIQRHGGKIWADAELGQGATFYFTL